MCPAQDALVIAVALPDAARKSATRSIPAWGVAAGIAVLFFGLTGYAKLSGHWNTRLPRQVYFDLVSHAREVQHP